MCMENEDKCVSQVPVLENMTSFKGILNSGVLRGSTQNLPLE